MRVSLGIRKLVVLILAAAIFLLANAWLVVNWLEDRGRRESVYTVREHPYESLGDGGLHQRSGPSGDGPSPRRFPRTGDGA